MAIQTNINSDLSIFTELFLKEVGSPPDKIIKESFLNIFKNNLELESLYVKLSERKVELTQQSYAKGTIQYKIIKLLLKEEPKVTFEEVENDLHVLMEIGVLLRVGTYDEICERLKAFSQGQLNTLFRGCRVVALITAAIIHRKDNVLLNLFFNLLTTDVKKEFFENNDVIELLNNHNLNDTEYVEMLKSFFRPEMSIEKKINIIINTKYRDALLNTLGKKELKLLIEYVPDDGLPLLRALVAHNHSIAFLPRLAKYSQVTIDNTLLKLNENPFPNPLVFAISLNNKLSISTLLSSVSQEKIISIHKLDQEPGPLYAIKDVDIFNFIMDALKNDDVNLLIALNESNAPLLKHYNHNSNFVRAIIERIPCDLRVDYINKSKIIPKLCDHLVPDQRVSLKTIFSLPEIGTLPQPNQSTGTNETYKPNLLDATDFVRVLNYDNGGMTNFEFLLCQTGSEKHIVAEQIWNVVPEGDRKKLITFSSDGTSPTLEIALEKNHILFEKLLAYVEPNKIFGAIRTRILNNSLRFNLTACFTFLKFLPDYQRELLYSENKNITKLLNNFTYTVDVKGYNTIADVEVNTLDDLISHCGLPFSETLKLMFARIGCSTRKFKKESVLYIFENHFHDSKKIIESDNTFHAFLANLSIVDLLKIYSKEEIIKEYLNLELFDREENFTIFVNFLNTLTSDEQKRVLKSCQFEEVTLKMLRTLFSENEIEFKIHTFSIDRIIKALELAVTTHTEAFIANATIKYFKGNLALGIKFDICVMTPWLNGLMYRPAELEESFAYSEIVTQFLDNTAYLKKMLDKSTFKEFLHTLYNHICQSKNSNIDLLSKKAFIDFISLQYNALSEKEQKQICHDEHIPLLSILYNSFNKQKPLSVEKFIQEIKLNTSIDLEVEVAAQAFWIDETQFNNWIRRVLNSKYNQDYLKAMTYRPELFLEAFSQFSVDYKNLGAQEFKQLFLPEKRTTTYKLDTIWSYLNYKLGNTQSKIIEAACILFNVIPFQIKYHVAKSKEFAEFIGLFIKAQRIASSDLENINVDYVLQKLNLNSSPLIQTVIANQIAVLFASSERPNKWMASILARPNAIKYLQHVIHYPALAKVLLEQDASFLENLVSDKKLSDETKKAILPLNSPSEIVLLSKSFSEEERKTILSEKITFTLPISQEVITDVVSVLLKELHEKIIVNMKESKDNQLVILEPFLNSLSYHLIACAFQDSELQFFMKSYIPFLTTLQLAVILPLLSNEDLLAYIKPLDETKRRECIALVTGSQRQFLLDHNMHYPGILLDWEQSKDSLLRQLEEPYDQDKVQALKNSLLAKFVSFRTPYLLDKLAKSMDKALDSKHETGFNKEDANRRKKTAMKAAVKDISAAINKLDQLQAATEIPAEYLDPIYFNLMKEPIHLSDGSIVDRPTLAQSIFNGKAYANPFTRVQERKDLPIDVQL